MGKLGVCQIYSFEKNLNIVLLHHEKHGRQLTTQRLSFLCMVWKGEHRETARQLKDKYMTFLRMSQSEQFAEMDNARQYLSERIITEVSETCYGTKEIYKR